ncbi:proline-rich receptor-like protein kinase PERK9 [Iris pallida]|uniref:Proline-rich receptor-like protein kinase PERK9 n=1 Tax=Iris pallida TaxID=29817 RepID=A0AAX6DVM6_IRIPA|nr:proline-rich receptor-like protein kinase PERK9 [Iris pallida]
MEKKTEMEMKVREGGGVKLTSTLEEAALRRADCGHRSCDDDSSGGRRHVGKITGADRSAAALDAVAEDRGPRGGGDSRSTSTTRVWDGASDVGSDEAWRISMVARFGIAVGDSQRRRWCGFRSCGRSLRSWWIDRGVVAWLPRCRFGL